jgi:hypothetical protein
LTGVNSPIPGYSRFWSEHALVLSLDEKNQIQALHRTQPGLPMKKGRYGTMTHDYKRHGTTTRFAALDVLEGKVIGQCMALHRHQEFIRLLNRINRETPASRDLHLIVDIRRTRMARTTAAIQARVSIAAPTLPKTRNTFPVTVVAIQSGAPQASRDGISSRWQKAIAMLSPARITAQKRHVLRSMMPPRLDRVSVGARSR